MPTAYLMAVADMRLKTIKGIMMEINQMANNLLLQMDKTRTRINAVLAFFDRRTELDSFSYILHGDGQVWFTIPYDAKKFGEFRQALGAGWRRDFEWPAGCGKGISYFMNGMVFNVLLNIDLEGATCRKVKMGEKVEPIYEIVCS